MALRLQVVAANCTPTVGARALVVGINPEGGSAGLLDWLWRQG